MGYKTENEIEYLADFPGADVPRDLVKVSIADWVTGTLLVQEEHPLDVSGAEIDVDLNSQTLSAITITDDGSLDINTMPAQTIGTWNAGTLSIQEATPLDVSGATVPTEQQTPVSVEDSGGTTIDPASEATLSELSASLASAGGDTLLTTRTDEHRAVSRVIDAGEVYHVESTETWVVNDLTVDGILDVRGTVAHYGDISGSGTIIGGGTITNRGT